MSELDQPDEPTTNPDFANSQGSLAAASSSVPEPVESNENRVETEDLHTSLTNGQAEPVEEILSDAAALELMGDVERNGPPSEPVVASAAPVEPADLVFPAPAKPPSLPALLDAVQTLGEQVNGRLEALQSLVERELRAEMTRERVVDRLHAELQEYKQDLLLKVMRPLFVDLIQLHDDIGKMADSRPSASAESGSESEPNMVRPLLDSIRTAIEDILYRQGVEPFEEEQATFDAKRQRAVTTVPTEDPDLIKTVAARLRKGFQAGEKIIRPEIVSVYTLKK